MVPINLNLYTLKEKIIREINRRLNSIEIFDAPLDGAWLLYGASIIGKKDNPIFIENIKILQKWSLEEDSGKKHKDVAPLALCVHLSSKSEIREICINKIEKILKEVLSKFVPRFNILNDPEQIFCFSLVIKNLSERTRTSIVKKLEPKPKGKILRKILFLASLIEINNIQENKINKIFSDIWNNLNNNSSYSDIISTLWFMERYKEKFKNDNLLRVWKIFDRIYPALDISSEYNSRNVLLSRDLALLLEATVCELKYPDPLILLDLYPIHPDIKKIAKDYFKNEKYANAVFEAAKKLNEFIQNKTGIKDKDEVDLVQATMKKIRNLEELKIKFNDYLSEDSGKNEQKGLALIAEGIFCAFRNPKGHKPEDHPLVNIDPYEALSRLIIIDYIWKRIEKAKINKKGNKNA